MSLLMPIPLIRQRMHPLNHHRQIPHPMRLSPTQSGTPTPRWSIWAQTSAIYGADAAVGIGVAMFNVAAGFLCVAAGPALICGLVGLVNISEPNGRLKGRGFAVVGVVMGCVGLFMLVHLMSSQLATHFTQYPPFSFPSDD